MGGLLKALDERPMGLHAPPATHRSFSELTFRWNEQSAARLVDENDTFGGVPDERLADDEEPAIGRDSAVGAVSHTMEQSSVGGGWLEDDDIEEA